MGGSECDGIARLDAEGKQDPGFTNTIPDGVRFSVDHGEFIETMAVQADGKVLVGGTFEQVNNFYRAALARLGTDGSVDQLFNQESGTSFIMLSTAVQPDGKLLLGGQFSYVNGAPRTGLGRLNADGSLDTSFDAGTNEQVRTVKVQPDGRILVGGAFTTLGGELAALAEAANKQPMTNILMVALPAEIRPVVRSVATPTSKVRTPDW
jgi:uncharacterized delta-60 repeat protein